MSLYWVSFETKEMARPFVPNRPAFQNFTQIHAQLYYPQENHSRTSTANTMQVRISRAVHAEHRRLAVLVVWHVIVDDDVHTLNVNASTEDVRCHKDTLLEILELLETAQPETR